MATFSCLFPVYILHLIDDNALIHHGKNVNRSEKGTQE